MMIFSYFYHMIEGAIQKALRLYDSQFQQNLVQSILPIWLIFFTGDRPTKVKKKLKISADLDMPMKNDKRYTFTNLTG